MPGIRIEDKGVLGIHIDVPYVTNRGTEREISVTVADAKEFINVAATGDLNADGLQALKQAIAIAEAIQQRGYQS